MRDRSIDEFEAMFEQAAIPALNIENVPIKRVALVVKGDPLDQAVVAIAAYLKMRFVCDVQLHYPAGTSDIDTLRLAKNAGANPMGTGFSSTAELVGQVSIGRSQLVLLPKPENESAQYVDLDALVQGTTPPVLIIRQPVAKPQALFARILHSLSGSFRQTQNFSYSFTLAETNSSVVLLHVIDDGDIADVREALKVSPDIEDQTGDALLDSLARHGERYLRAVVASCQDRPFEVTYRLAIGHVVSAVKQELNRGSFSLLVIGSHQEGSSLVNAEDYQLMHQTLNTAVLAL